MTTSPSSISYSVARNLHGDGDDYVEAHKDGKNIGYLRLGPGGTINHVKVKRRHRRHGVATGLYNEAERLGMNPTHTDILSSKGRRWKESFGKFYEGLPEDEWQQKKAIIQRNIKEATGRGVVIERGQKAKFKRPKALKKKESFGKRTPLTPEDWERELQWHKEQIAAAKIKGKELGRKQRIANKYAKNRGSFYTRDQIFSGLPYKPGHVRTADALQDKTKPVNAKYRKATHQERTIEEHVKSYKGLPHDKALAAEGKRRASEWNRITSGGLQKSLSQLGAIAKEWIDVYAA